MPSIRDLTSRYASWLAAAAIAVAVLAAYAPGLHTPFQYDDPSGIGDNASIRELSALGAVLSPPPNETTSGRPLLNLLFAVDYAIGGLDVTGYHVTNIALHLVCAFLLLAIVRVTLAWPSVGLAGQADVLAVATAAIWAVHPLQTGTVTYISGRSESLMAVWYLATMLAALRAYRSSHAAAWTAASIAACAIGMGCKESMVTAPIVVVLYDRAYLYTRFTEAFRDRWRLYAGLAATWAIAAWLAMQAPHSASAGFSTGVSSWTYLLNQAVVIPEYLRLVVWPDHLLFSYGEVRPLALGDVGALAVIVPALLAAAGWLWYRRPALGFPAVWVFLTLAPTSSFVPIATEAGAARRMYLPLAGIVILFTVAIATAMLRRRRGAAAGTPRRSAASVPAPPPSAAGGVLTVFTALVVVLAMTTAAQSREFASAEQLWRGSLEHWPSATAHRNLAAVLLQQGRRADATEHLRAASALMPQARYALGVALFDDGRSAEAIVELQAAIDERPDDPTIGLDGRRVLGRALQKEGRHLDAATVFGEVAARTPGDIEPMLARAEALLAGGDLTGAHEAYRRVLGAVPDHLGALTNDGLVLLRLGRLADAVPVLRAVAERQPRSRDAYINLAGAYAASGRLADAAVAACQASTIDPLNPSSRQFLAELHAAARAARVTLPECREAAGRR